jgi:hypothetical protein
VGDRERDDALLDQHRELVRHPWPAALARAQHLKPVAVDLLLPGVIGRAVDPKRPAGSRHRGASSQLKKLQAVAEQRVIIGHAAHLLPHLAVWKRA